MITSTKFQFVRAGRAGAGDVRLRTPELSGLSNRALALFGLGCLGAPSAVEFARAGAGELRLLDHDIVDPGTIGRWPVGLSAAGLKKVEVLRELIRHDYPYSRVKTYDHWLGAVRDGRLPGGTDQEVVAEMTDGAAAIYDATAEFGVQHFLSDVAYGLNIPYVCVDATHGGWGGRVCRIDPSRTAGCWLCFQAAQLYGPIELPPAASPDTAVQARGCAAPTFTGASFDLTQVALTGVRAAVETVCAGEGYPRADWDVTIIAFRDGVGNLVPPTFKAYKLEKHPRCPRCSAQ